jgi:hypothetical protein
MDELRIGDQLVRYDRELTLHAYAQIEKGGAEECGCSHCKNFAAQRALAYPGSIPVLLEKLGIDLNKEGEVYEVYAEGRTVHYGGWFYFSGQLIAAGKYLGTESGTDFQFHLVDARYLPKPSVNFGDQVLAIDFTTTLPWILEGEP